MSEKRKRDVAVIVRLTEAEKKRIADAAQAFGVGIGVWLRILGLKAAGPLPPSTDSPKDDA